MKNYTTEILLKARDLISNGWTRNAYAQNRQGEQVDPTDSNADKFCPIGAVKAAKEMIQAKYGQRYSTEAYVHQCRAIAFLNQVVKPISCIEEFNDQQETKSPVLSAFHYAIELSNQGDT